MNEIKAGQRIKMMKRFNNATKGMIGTIIENRGIFGHGYCGIDFGIGFYGHNLLGKLTKDTGYYIPKGYFEAINEDWDD